MKNAERIAFFVISFIYFIGGRVKLLVDNIVS